MFSIKGCFLGLMAALSGAAPAARADEILETPAEITRSPSFVHYLETDLVQAMSDVARGWDGARGAACSGDVVLTPLSAMGVVRPVVMPDGADAPASGVWGMVLRFERCGRAIVYRMQIEIKPGQDRRILRIVPGETTINNHLMRRALPPMMDAARTAADKADCNAIALLDSFLLEKTAEYGRSPTEGFARERWWFNVCGSIVAVDADFFPSRERPEMAFTVKPAGEPGAYAVR